MKKADRDAELSEVVASRDWYKRRCEALQEAQAEFRDPERQIVCDILANGRRDRVIEQNRAGEK